MRLQQVISWGLFVWTGLLAGVSFVATPAKFLAPSLPLPIALDVGRVTFHVLATIEWSLLALFVALLVLSWRSNPACRSVAVLLALVGVALAVETFALRPHLDARVAEIIAGNTPAKNSLHTIYIALEVAKLALLAAAAFVQGRSGHGGRQGVS